MWFVSIVAMVIGYIVITIVICTVVLFFICFGVEYVRNKGWQWEKLLIILPLLFISNKVFADWEVKAMYFYPEVKKMHGNLYVEGEYNWDFLEAGIGYTNLSVGNCVESHV